MSLTIDDEDVGHLARALTAVTGETINQAIRTALEQRLERERLRRGAKPDLAERMLEAAKEFAASPDLDPRSADEIIEYDEIGMWR
jgi:antitoxin VapB